MVASGAQNVRLQPQPSVSTFLSTMRPFGVGCYAGYTNHSDTTLHCVISLSCARARLHPLSLTFLPERCLIVTTVLANPPAQNAWSSPATRKGRFFDAQPLESMSSMRLPASGLFIAAASGRRDDCERWRLVVTQVRRAGAWCGRSRVVEALSAGWLKLAHRLADSPSGGERRGDRRWWRR